MKKLVGSSLLTALLTLTLPSLWSQTDLTEVLPGKWKVEGAEIVESWELQEPGLLTGKSVRLANGSETVLEELTLRKVKDKWIYTALVYNQNDGKPIDFKQSESENGVCFSNKKHDFPKRICYTFLSDKQIVVLLSGEGEESVAITLKRVEDEAAPEVQNDNPNYDAELAKRLGADDYGMKGYVLVILKTGDNDSASAQQSQELFRGHMDNIRRLVDEDKLIVAGPLGRNENAYRGIFIMNMTDVEEVRQIMDTDPAIAAGLLAVDLYPWYGSAALPEYLPASDKVWTRQP